MQANTTDLEKVMNDPRVLSYVKQQTEALCLEAIKRNGLVIQYTKDKTEEICLEAVKQNERALKFVQGVEEEVIVAQFGTYNGPLKIFSSTYGKGINAGCWFGDLEAFKIKVWEQFELGFKHQTKEEVEKTIEKLAKFW